MNSFGYWRSTLYSGVEPGTMYRATFRVSSSTSPPNAPVLRLRAASGDFQQSNELWADSRTDGLFSPTAEGREYELYFLASPYDNTLGLTFELLHFDASNEAGYFFLDEVSLTSLPDFSQMAREGSLTKEYNFADDDENWTTGSSDDFNVPDFTHEDGALILSPKEGEISVFGYWTSPQEIALDPERFYVVTFEVESSATEEERHLVPTFRCRLNESSFHQAVAVQVTSHSRGELCPSAGRPNEYKMFLRPSGADPDAKLILSFDLIYFIEENRPMDLNLNRVKIESTVITP